jgi:hypothetical protein
MGLSDLRKASVKPNTGFVFSDNCRIMKARGICKNMSNKKEK